MATRVMKCVKQAFVNGREFREGNLYIIDPGPLDAAILACFVDTVAREVQGKEAEVVESLDKRPNTPPPEVKKLDAPPPAPAVKSKSKGKGK